MNTQIDALLEQLKQARQDSAEASAELTKMMDEFKKSEGYKAFEMQRNQARTTVETIEDDIRVLALADYHESGKKDLHPKIKVKIFKTFSIVEADKTRAWVFNNLPAALKLDEKKVEKYAHEFGEVPGTWTDEEPRIQIASEL